jgi:hypothetical protein
VATVGEYTDRDGAKKKRFANVGILFEDEQGRMSLKLDTVPVAPGWSGWISFYPPQDRSGRTAAPRQQGTADAAPAAAPDDGDEIPF